MSGEVLELAPTDVLRVLAKAGQTFQFGAGNGLQCGGNLTSATSRQLAKRKLAVPSLDLVGHPGRKHGEQQADGPPQRRFKVAHPAWRVTADAATPLHKHCTNHHQGR